MKNSERRKDDLRLYRDDGSLFAWIEPHSPFVNVVNKGLPSPLKTVEHDELSVSFDVLNESAKRASTAHVDLTDEVEWRLRVYKPSMVHLDLEEETCDE